MDITTVGFGAWAIGGGDWAFGWGEQDDADSVAAIRHAVELGINWVDTAAVYGLGHSEEVVGRALKEIPEAERPLLFTKCGLIWDEADRQRAPRRNSGADGARGVRGLAAAPRRRAHRPLPVPLARPGGDAARGVLGHAPRPARRGQDPRGRGLQLHRRAARGLRGHRPRRVAPAAVLDDRARHRAGAAALVRRARDRRDRLQPDGLGPAHRRLHARARRGAGLRRLALEEPEYAEPNLARNLALADALSRLSRSATAPPPRRSRSPGPSPGRGSAAPSSAPGRPSRSPDGSTPPASSSPARTSTS